MLSEKNPATILAIGYSVSPFSGRSVRRVQAIASTIAIDHFGDADTRRVSNDRWIAFEPTLDGRLSTETLAAIQSMIASNHAMRNDNSKAIFLLPEAWENLGSAVEPLRCIAPVLGPTEAQRSALRDPRFLQDAAHKAELCFPSSFFDNPPSQNILTSSFSSNPIACAGRTKHSPTKSPRSAKSPRTRRLLATVHSRNAGRSYLHAGRKPISIHRCHYSFRSTRLVWLQRIHLSRQLRTSADPRFVSRPHRNALRHNPRDNPLHRLAAV